MILIDGLGDEVEIWTTGPMFIIAYFGLCIGVVNFITTLCSKARNSSRSQIQFVKKVKNVHA